MISHLILKEMNLSMSKMVSDLLFFHKAAIAIMILSLPSLKTKSESLSLKKSRKCHHLREEVVSGSIQLKLAGQRVNSRLVFKFK